MTAHLWRALDHHTGLDAHDASPERRARVRFIGALAAIGCLAGLALAPLSAMTGGNPWIGLGAAASCLGFLLWLRRPDRVDRVAHVMSLMIAGLGVGLAVALPTPGNPSLAWLIVLGLTPLTFKRRGPRLAYATVPFALAAVFAPPPPTAAGLSPLGGVLGVVIVCVVMVALMVATHRMAVAELEAELVAQRDVETDLVRAAVALRAGADESVGSLVTLNHAVRTPLNGLIGVADLLLHEDDDGDSPEARAAIHELRDASRGVLDVLETLLCLARATARGGQAPAATDLPATLAAAAARAKSARPQHDVTLAGHADALPRVVMLDAAALRVSLDQLLGAMARLDLRDTSVSAEQRGDALVVRLVGTCAGSTLTSAHARCDGAVEQLGLSVVGALASAVGGALSHHVGLNALAVELTLPSVPVAAGDAAWANADAISARRAAA